MTTREEKKAACIEALARAREELLEVIGALPEEKQGEVFLGSWSAYELVAHLCGWDEANLEAVEAVLSGKLPDFYCCYNRDWRIFNAHLISRYNQGDFTVLIRNAREANQRLIERLKRVPADQFDRDCGLRFKGWIVTIARLMRAETKDEQEHRRQVVEFTDKN